MAKEIDPDLCAVCGDRITAPNPKMFCSGVCAQSMQALHQRTNERMMKESAR